MCIFCQARTGHALCVSHGALRNSTGTDNLLDYMDHPADEDYIDFNIGSTYEQKSRKELEDEDVLECTTDNDSEKVNIENNMPVNKKKKLNNIDKSANFLSQMINSCTARDKKVDV